MKPRPSPMSLWTVEMAAERPVGIAWYLSHTLAFRVGHPKNRAGLKFSIHFQSGPRGWCGSKPNTQEAGREGRGAHCKK